jgi:hypothetical protein
MYGHVPQPAVRVIAKEKAMPGSLHMDQLATALFDIPNPP